MAKDIKPTLPITNYIDYDIMLEQAQEQMLYDRNDKEVEEDLKSK